MKSMKMLFLAIGLSFYFAQIAPAEWTPAMRLTWTSGGSWFPAITVDSSGHLHVVWSDSTPGNDEIYCKQSTDAGVTWTASQRLTWNSGGSTGPVIAADSSGHLHVVWYDDTPGNTEIYYKKSTDAGVTWSTNQRLTWTSSESNHPALAVGSTGGPQVIWYNSPPDDIYYRKSTDGGSAWSAIQRLTWSISASYGPAVAADSSGNPHIVWYEGASGGGTEIFYKKSSDGGATWLPTRRLSWTSGYSSEPGIAAVSTGHLYVAWNDDTSGNDEIYFRKSTDDGVTWTASQRLTWTSGSSTGPVVAGDSSLHLHLVWRDNTPGNDEIYCKQSTDAGVTWTASQRLTWNSGPSQYPASSVDSSGNLHIVWSDYTPGNIEIYYRKYMK